MPEPQCPSPSARALVPEAAGRREGHAIAAHAATVHEAIRHMDEGQGGRTEERAKVRETPRQLTGSVLAPLEAYERERERDVVLVASYAACSILRVL